MAVFYSAMLLKTCFLCLFVNASVLAKSACDLNVKVKQVLLNEGFHRNITYGIVFSEDNDDDWLYKNCVVGLDQGLPAGVYVNADELDELKRTRRLKAMTKRRINRELPAEESRPMSVYVVAKVLDNKVSMWLPVHARYHHSQPGGGTARNKIMPPKLFLRCPDQRLDVCGGSVAPSVSFLCNGAPKDKCSVKEIPYTVMTDTLIWDVPVGDMDQYYAVAFGTSLAVMSGSLYLLRAIHEAKMHMRNRWRKA